MIKLFDFHHTTKADHKATVMETNQTDPQTLNVDFYHSSGPDLYHVVGNALILTNGTCHVDAKIFCNRRRAEDSLSKDAAHQLRQKAYKHVKGKTSREIELFHTDF